MTQRQILDPRDKAALFAESNTGSTSFTMLANSTQGITVNGIFHDRYLQSSQQTDANVKPWNRLFFDPSFDIYVGTNNDENYRLGTGSSLSLSQLSIIFYHYDNITPREGASTRTNVWFWNQSGDSHTVYFNIRGKIILWQ